MRILERRGYSSKPTYRARCREPAWHTSDTAARRACIALRRRVNRCGAASTASTALPTRASSAAARAVLQTSPHSTESLFHVRDALLKVPTAAAASAERPRPLDRSSINTEAAALPRLKTRKQTPDSIPEAIADPYRVARIAADYRFTPNRTE